MAIELNDNIKILAPKPLDSRKLKEDGTLYANITEANAGTTQRHIRLTVNLVDGEYWYKDGILDENLIAKQSSLIPTLQQILDNNSTLIDNNNFQGEGAGNYNTGISVLAFGKGAGKENSSNNINLFGQNAQADADSQTVFSKSDSEIIMARLSYLNLTTSQKVEMINESGLMTIQIYKNSDFVAVNGGFYVTNGILINVYDPTPIEGQGYIVYVSAGTMRIAPIAYPRLSLVYRFYSNGIWETTLINTDSTFLLNRDNHTGTQPSSTISNFSNSVDARITSLRIINALGATPEFSANKGAANGYVPLNNFSKIDENFLPDSILGQVEFISTWNATTNTPVIPTASNTNKGWYYIVNVDGATSIDAINDWKVGDWIVSNGAVWSKIDNTDAISSFNNRTGAIVLSREDVIDALTYRPLNKDLNGTDFQDIKTTRFNLGANKLTTYGNVNNQQIAVTDEVVVTNAAFTAPRTWFLPAANSFKPGTELIVADLFGAITATNTLTIFKKPGTTDTINNALSLIMGAVNGMRRFITDGISKWTFDAGVMRISDYIGAGYSTLNAIVATDTAGKLVTLTPAIYPSLAELAFVKGVTSAIQAQINLKANINSPTFTGTTTVASLVVSGGAVSTYLNGFGSAFNFNDAVRTATLTTLVIGVNTPINAGNSVLVAFQNIQAQIGSIGTKVDNNSTVVLTTADLNAAYPSPSIVSEVYCGNIVAGKMLYKRTATYNVWVGITVFTP